VLCGNRSQEHLASAAGLSVRTVQRVEIDGVPSAETRLALAAALGVPVADLMPVPSSPNAPVVDRPSADLMPDPRFRPEGAAALRGNKALFAVGVGIVLTLASLMLLVVLLNALTGWLPRG
jgi:transcriptional regulator with XRE-family HTH domain